MQRILKIIPPFVKEIRLASAIRETFEEGYSAKLFLKDLQAGFIVAVIAFPLAMALSIASGVAPQHGLYTIVIGGILIALLGGSRYQVTGPTTSFVILLLPIVQQYGIAGLLVAGLMSGLLCISYGVMRLGDVIQYVPHPVTTGFTSGVALVIGVMQLKDFFGFSVPNVSSDFVHKVLEIIGAFSSLNIYDLSTGAITLTLMLFAHFRFKKIPPPIFALTIVTLASVFVSRWLPDFSIVTIAQRFSYHVGDQVMNGVPRGMPSFNWPWNWTSPQSNHFQLDWLTLKELLPSAFAISVLGSIETLLSATVADGMTGKKHNPNTELIALGIGNVICPFFGGIPAVGGLARTTTNIRYGAYSPISSIVHAVIVGLVLFILAPVTGAVPMAALAALLIFVAWNLFDRQHFVNILKLGSWDDRLVLLTCFGLTVLFDMKIGVGVGMLLSSTLFIRKMALLTESELIQDAVHIEGEPDVPVGPHVLYYRIRGTLFFGAAQRAMERLSRHSTAYTHAVIDLDDVYFIDLTGLVALQSALQKLKAMNLKIAIVTPHQEVQHELQKLGMMNPSQGGVQILKHRNAAVKWTETPA